MHTYKRWPGTSVQALAWHQEEKSKVAETARDQARETLTVDFSALRGRGPEFVLEFTAIVVIIFAAVILGVVEILNGEQIGTLLAAIADYVLGRSTSGGRSVPQGGTTKAPLGNTGGIEPQPDSKGREP